MSLPQALAASLALAGAAPDQTDQPATIVFGDSSAEQGNLYSLPGQQRPGTPYYTQGGFSRESNGPVWPEYLVPGIVAERGASLATRNLNYATSGATSGRENVVTPDAPGLTGQVDRWLARAASTGVRPGLRDRVVVAAGVNDFIRDLGTRDLRETSREVIGNLSGNVERIARAGARRILVEDMPAFIQAPQFNDIVPAADRAELDRVMAGLLATHNAAQVQAMATLNARLADTDIVTVKMSRLFDYARAHAGALGFAVTSRACYDEDRGSLCSTDPAQQNRYLFFDGLHLTTRAQALQAAYYGALLDQLDGSANRAAATIGIDTLGQLEEDAAAERAERHRSWAAPEAAPGLALLGDVRFGSERRSAAVDRLAASVDRRAYRFGLGYGDGEGWAMRLVGSRLESRDTHALGRTDLNGWGVAAAGERRFGALRLGASVGYLWGEAQGRRVLPVATMAVTQRTRVTGSYAELEAGYVWRIGPLTAQPSAWLRYGRATVQGFEEEGETGLESRWSRYRYERLDAGGALTLSWAGSAIWTPRVTVSWERGLAGGRGTLTGLLIDNSADPIATRIATGWGERAAIEPGLALALGGKALLDLSGWQRLGTRERGARARLRFAF